MERGEAKITNGSNELKRFNGVNHQREGEKRGKNGKTKGMDGGKKEKMNVDHRRLDENVLGQLCLILKQSIVNKGG